jgi:hypothetical protein
MHSELPIVVTYEDRPSAIPGAELLARSLNRHSPHLQLKIYSPLGEIGDRLADLPRVTYVRSDDLSNRGWNVKPEILRRALATHDRVLWLDTDIVITSDIERLISRFDYDAFVVGQEFRLVAEQAGCARAEAYGLTPDRPPPYAVNSGSILASRRHQMLIEKWSTLLSNDQYQAAQRQPVGVRPAAFVSDQEALWALLASKDAREPKLDYFRTGTDMILHAGANGYSVFDRISRPSGKGFFFVHMLGRYKPWSFDKVPSLRGNTTDYLHLVFFELSPFFQAAQPFSTHLGNPAWLKMRTLPARILNLLFAGNVALRGLPLALAAWIFESLGRQRRL